MSVFAQYETSKYNALPDIRSVVKTLTKSGAHALTKGALKDVITRHNVADKFGIALLHAPFYLEGESVPAPPEEPLGDGERVVSFGPIAIALNTSTLAPDAQAHIVPAVWGFHGGAITPLQFADAADPAADALTAGDRAFLEEVCAIVAKTPGAEGLGIALLAYTRPGITVIDRRNAITLPAYLGRLALGDERYDVLWAVQGDEAVAIGAASGGNLASHFDCYGYNTGQCNCWSSGY